MEKYYGIYYTICFIWYLAFIGIMLYLYFHSSRPYPSKFKSRLYDKIPSSLNPGELSNLIYKKINTEVFTATILVLIKKQILSIKKQKDDYVISLTKNNLKLSTSQKLALNILISDMGDREKVTFKQIEEYSMSQHNCSEFLINYQIWLKTMIRESNKKRFYEDKLEYHQVRSMRNLGIILFAINILLGYNSFVGFFIIIPTVFVVFYFYSIFKRTISANEEYHKWLAFKRYLNHIEGFKHDKENVSSYLIYGLVLKTTDLEYKLTKSRCFEKLNALINHNVIMSNLKGNRKFKS